MGAPFGRSGACSYRILPVELFIRRFERHGQGHARLLYYCMAVPMGVCTHIVTGGVFVAATPHCVRAVRGGYEEHDCANKSSVLCRYTTHVVHCLYNGTLQKSFWTPPFDIIRVPPLEKWWTQDAMTLRRLLITDLHSVLRLEWAS